MTAQQLATALAQYQTLKAEMVRVDDKYSLVYHEPDLDLPESLELEPLVHTPLTDEQIALLAEAEVQAWYLAETEKIRKQHTEKTNELTSKQTKLLNDFNAKSAKLTAELAQKADEIKAKIAKNGMANSSVLANALQQNATYYADKIDAESTDYQNDLAVVLQELDDLDDGYTARLTALDGVKQAKIATASEEIRQKDEKTATNVAKYNQTLNEKETKYQASCQRTIQYALQAEYQRALDAARIYAEVGDDGAEMMKLNEKLTLAKAFLGGMSQEMATAVVTSDSFMRTSLGAHYEYLITYIGNLPSEQ